MFFFQLADRDYVYNYRRPNKSISRPITNHGHSTNSVKDRLRAQPDASPSLLSGRNGSIPPTVLCLVLLAHKLCKT
jgi:hypothetical protein